MACKNHYEEFMKKMEDNVFNDSAYITKIDIGDKTYNLYPYQNRRSGIVAYAYDSDNIVILFKSFNPHIPQKLYFYTRKTLGNAIFNAITERLDQGVGANTFINQNRDIITYDLVVTVDSASTVPIDRINPDTYNKKHDFSNPIY